MKCKKVFKKIVEISLGRISPQGEISSLNEIDKHIVQCSDCKKAREDINSIINITRTARKIDISKEEMSIFHNNIMQRVEQITDNSIKTYIKSFWEWKLVKTVFASAIIIVISFSVIWLNPFSEKKITSGSQITKKSIPSSLTSWPESENGTGIYYVDIGVI